MAHRSPSQTAPTVLFFAGLALFLVGVLPLLKRNGGTLDVILAIGGGALIALGIVIAVRASKVGQPPPREEPRP